MSTITYEMIQKTYYGNWASQMVKWLTHEWGLNRTLAERVTVMLLYASLYGFTWRITSGFRSPKRQQELLDRWNRGDRRGIVTKPAVNSKHSNTSWGQPDSLAVDLTSNNLYTLGAWAPYFALKWGGKFRSSDPVHFYI